VLETGVLETGVYKPLVADDVVVARLVPIRFDACSVNNVTPSSVISASPSE